MLEEYELEEGEIDERETKRMSVIFDPSTKYQQTYVATTQFADLTSYVKVPDELCALILDCVASGPCFTAADVRQRVADRAALMLTCRALGYQALVPSDAKTCMSPASWTNIWMSNGEWMDGYKKPSLEHVKSQLQWSNKKDVHIGILLPSDASASHTYLEEIWTEFMKPEVRSRLKGIHILGPYQCYRDRNRCLRSQLLDPAWFGAIFNHPRPEVISAESFSPDGVDRLCNENHPPTRIDITGLTSLGYPFPLILVNPAPSDCLKHLDIRNQDHLLARSLVQFCTGLLSLVWGRNGLGASSVPSVVLPHLRQLTVISLRHFPPINGPNLTKLTIADDYFGFTNDMLTTIVGHSGSLPAMCELDVFHSPMTNIDLMDVFSRCPLLTTVRAETRAEVRTMFFTAIVARVRGIYAYHRGSLSTVEFSRAPSSTRKDENAVPAFRLMQYLGRSSERKEQMIAYHREPWRVRVDDFPGHFDATLDEMQALCSLNGWDDDFLAALKYDESLERVPVPTEDSEPGTEKTSRCSVVCVFASRRAAEDCVLDGVVVRSGVVRRGKLLPSGRKP